MEANVTTTRPFFIFTRPTIRRSLYEGFVEEFEELLTYTYKKLDHARVSFRNNRHYHFIVRKRKVLAAFINLAYTWQDITTRARHAIGHGFYIEEPDLPMEWMDAENPQWHQLQSLVQVMNMSNHSMQEVLLHASTRLIDDGGL